MTYSTEKYTGKWRGDGRILGRLNGEWVKVPIEGGNEKELQELCFFLRRHQSGLRFLKTKEGNHIYVIVKTWKVYGPQLEDSV